MVLRRLSSQNIIDKIGVMVLGLDDQGRISLINAKGCELLGYSSDELIGMDWSSHFIQPLDRKPVGELFSQIMAGKMKHATYHENVILIRSGEQRVIAWHNTILKDSAGKVSGMLCTGEDITHRKQAEEHLEKSEHHFRCVVENIADGLFIFDVQGRFVDVNVQACDSLGYSREELLTLGIVDIDPDFPPQKVATVIEQILGTGGPLTFQGTHRHKDGHSFPVEVKVDVFDRGGEPHFIAVARDLSERETRVKELRQTEEEWEKTFDAISDIITIQDQDMRIVRVNKAGRVLGSGDMNSIIGRHCYELLYESNEPCEGCPVVETILDGRPHSRVMQYRGSSSRYEVTSAPVFDEQSDLLHVVHIARDVTGRVRAEEERVQLMAAIDQTSDAIIVTDTEPAIQYVNPAFEQLTGYSFEEVRGRNPRMLQSGVHGAEFYKEMWQALVHGRVWKGQLVNKRKNGELLEEDVTISPVHNRAGMITNYVAVKRDITKEVSLERQLNQAMKMEAIGTLAGGIAHDFNNILSAVLGYAEIVNMQLAVDDPVKKDVDQIIIAGNRATALVQQILTFSRQEEEDLRPVKLQFIVKEVLKLLRSSLPTTIELHQDIDPDCGFVLVDPTRIHQVLMNLCTNAKQAMGSRGGELWVSLEEICVDSTSPVRQHLSIEQGCWLDLAVRDTGCGIEPHIKEKIFDPFFTTKEKGKGTGLGLSVVHGIVKSHGGEITVSSLLEEGTTFHIYLPVIETEQSTKGTGTHTPLPRGSHERILLVDDELMLVNILGRILTSLGYTVVSFTDSEKALQQFRDHGDEIDLVITDMTMPKLTGAELVQEILALRSEMPIILCTGFSEILNADQAKALGVREYITKPVDKATLATVVRKVLDAG